LPTEAHILGIPASVLPFISTFCFQQVTPPTWLFLKVF